MNTVCAEVSPPGDGDPHLTRAEPGTKYEHQPKGKDMIVGLRSALLCDHVEQDAHGVVNYLGVHGGTLIANSRPGLLDVWISLVVELDGRATAGHVQVRAADYDQTIPFEAPAGLKLSAIAFPILITLLRKGALTVSVTDDAPHGRTLSTSWTMDFAADAQVLAADATASFLAGSAQARDEMTAHLTAQQGRMH